VDFIKVPCGFVVGVMENSKCEKQSLTLKLGDAIFLYTDGVTEAMNTQGQMFSEARLKNRLVELKNKDIKGMIGSMREEVLAFVHGVAQSDDITMLAVRYRGK
jgi:sigma-B regulation protein RsbU (phosphoserine phosphatase)